MKMARIVYEYKKEGIAYTCFDTHTQELEK